MKPDIYKMMISLKHQSNKIHKIFVKIGDQPKISDRFITKLVYTFIIYLKTLIFYYLLYLVNGFKTNIFCSKSLCLNF